MRAIAGCATRSPPASRKSTRSSTTPRTTTSRCARWSKTTHASQTGRVFLQEARATQASARLAERALTEPGGLQHGSLAIRASQSIASHWLRPHLVAFKVAHPAIVVGLREGSSLDVATAVRNGSADIGFAAGALDDPELRLVSVASDRLVVVATPDHPLARNKASVFAAAIQARGLDAASMNVTLELPTNEAVCAAVCASRHLTVVSNLVARPPWTLVVLPRSLSILARAPSVWFDTRNATAPEPRKPSRRVYRERVRRNRAWTLVFARAVTPCPSLVPEGLVWLPTVEMVRSANALESPLLLS